MALIAVPTSVVVLFAFAFLGDDILTFFGITTVVIYSQIHEGLSHTLLVGLVILGAGLIILGMLWFASWLSKIMGITGIVIITRIMGLIVASIAVEFIMDGVALHFPELFGFEGHDE